MRKIAFSMALLSAISLSAFAKAPENLQTLKDSIIRYHDSGAYNVDITVLAQHAHAYLSERITQNRQLKHPKKLAIVLDIDETSLSNYPGIKAFNLGGTPRQINDIITQAKDPAIKPILKLYQFALKNNVSVFFVTGRKERLRTATIKNLRDAGYKKWQALYLKPNNYAQASVIPYKTAMRKKIASQGYDIVFNIGDQDSDLAGGYADNVYKVPDAMYYIP